MIRVFRTELQRQREKRDKALYFEYQQMISEPRSSKTEILKYLMSRYGIHSAATIYNIVAKMDKQIKSGVA